MNNDIEKIYLTNFQIEKKIIKLSKELNKKFLDKSPIFICILKGSVLFFSDLIKNITSPIKIDFMTISSYEDSTITTDNVKIISDVHSEVKDKDIVIVEDIVDSGNTLKFLRDLFIKRKAKSVTLVTLLDKPARRKVDIKPDYSCFVVDDEFFVGFGLDYKQLYRNLPYIGILKRVVYEK